MFLAPFSTRAQPVDSIAKDFKDVDGLNVSLNTTSGELTISKWDNEVHFKIKTNDSPTATRTQDGKEILEFSGYEARVYEISLGMEYEIVLPTRPLSNTFSFKIESKGLQFFYQPPLSDEVFPKGWVVNDTHAIDEGGIVRANRPIDKVGSYAVYGFKTGNKYKAGKVGDILRPLVYDSRGSKTYGELLITESTLSISVPGPWLDTAVYPVTIDPSFGNTVVGGSGWTIFDDQIFGFQASPSNNGILDSVSIHMATSNGQYSFDKAGLFRDSDDSFLVNSETDEKNTTGTGSYFWVTLTNSAPKANLLSIDDYIISLFHANTTGGGSTVVHYDNGANNYGHRDLVASYPNWNDPVVWTWEDVKYFSIYANYTIVVNYYLDAENLTVTPRIAGENATLTMDLETNSTPAFYWFRHNASGAWENTTATPWTINGSVSDWMWLSPQIGFPIEVQGYANTTDNINSTSLFFLTVTDTVSLITEEIWIGLVVWIFLVMVGLRAKEFYILAFASLTGVVVAIIVLMAGWTLVGLAILAVNLYLMYESLSKW
jgi:hypothetical protein